jgi:hypothetical protein
MTHLNRFFRNSIAAEFNINNLKAEFYPGRSTDSANGGWRPGSLFCWPNAGAAFIISHHEAILPIPVPDPGINLHFYDTAQPANAS